MHSFELTDRGKITVAVLVVIPILILSIILAVLAMAANTPEEPPDGLPPDGSVVDANSETITLPRPIETPEPPESGGFPPLLDNDNLDGSASEDTTSGDSSAEETQPDTDSDDEPDANGDSDTSDSPPLSDPSLNLSSGQLSFYFSPNIHSSLDRATSNLLNAFLNLPSNTPNNAIAIETPILPSDKSDLFMSVMASALGERNIDSRRITHIVNPEMQLGEHFEVLMYFITTEGK